MESDENRPQVEMGQPSGRDGGDSSSGYDVEEFSVSQKEQVQQLAREMIDAEVANLKLLQIDRMESTLTHLSRDVQVFQDNLDMIGGLFDMKRKIGSRSIVDGISHYVL